MALLGAKAVLVEKRDSFSRNNVLHLWPFLIYDLKALGAKKFFGKFCAGSIDHISELIDLCLVSAVYGFILLESKVLILNKCQHFLKLFLYFYVVRHLFYYPNFCSIFFF